MLQIIPNTLIAQDTKEKLENENNNKTVETSLFARGKTLLEQTGNFPTTLLTCTLSDEDLNFGQYAKTLVDEGLIMIFISAVKEAIKNILSDMYEFKTADTNPLIANEYDNNSAWLVSCVRPISQNNLNQLECRVLLLLPHPLNEDTINNIQKQAEREIEKLNPENNKTYLKDKKNNEAKPIVSNTKNKDTIIDDAIKDSIINKNDNEINKSINDEKNDDFLDIEAWDDDTNDYLKPEPSSIYADNNTNINFEYIDDDNTDDDNTKEFEPQLKVNTSLKQNTKKKKNKIIISENALKEMLLSLKEENKKVQTYIELIQKTFNDNYYDNYDDNVSIEDIEDIDDSDNDNNLLENKNDTIKVSEKNVREERKNANNNKYVNDDKNNKKNSNINTNNKNDIVENLEFTKNKNNKKNNNKNHNAHEDVSENNESKLQHEQIEHIVQSEKNDNNNTKENISNVINHMSYYKNEDLTCIVNKYKEKYGDGLKMIEGMRAENPELFVDIADPLDNKKIKMEKHEFNKTFDKIMDYFTNVKHTVYIRAQYNDYPQVDFIDDINRYIDQHTSLQMEDKPIMMEKLMQAMFGYDKLTALINDERVSDIKILAPDKINVKMYGKHYTVQNQAFKSSQALNTFIEALLTRNLIPVDKQILVFTDSSFHKDYILRFNITMPGINSATNPYLHIRKVPKKKTTIEDLIKAEMLPVEVAIYLMEKAKTSSGIVFAGPSASGKSTLMNALLDETDKEKSLLVIQESEELFSNILPNAMFQHIAGAYDLDALGTNGLLCDAGYFIIGEIKGKEARTFIRSANTGHKCWCSVHSPSARASLNRLADYVKYGSDYSFQDALKMLKDLEILIYIENFKVKQIDKVVGFDDSKGDLIYETVYRYDEK